MAALVKISRPRLFGVLPRERLFAALDRGRERPAVWVCGPPGAGKTTLIASYFEARAIPCLWYQVDEGDSDLATFFYYFGLAAAQVSSRRKKPLPLFTPEYAQGIAAFTRRYFQELYSRLKPPIAIVLDNYQEAANDSALHEVIRAGLEAAPAGITVIAASRASPPASLARLRANRGLEVIDWEELRLSEDEATAIAQMRKGREIGAEAIARAQGWAAGLMLMLAGGKDDGLTLSQSTPQELFDYFAAEIFQKTDRDIQEFLMETAFLPRISVQTAKALTSNPNAGAILDRLTSQNYFTTRQAEPIYQYHPMFRDFLRASAQNIFSGSRLNALKNRAARLLADEDMVEAAVELWCETEDWQTIAGVVMGRARSMLAQGRNQTLEIWFANLPDPILGDQPWLLFWRAIARLPFNPGESQAWLEQAFGLFKARGERAGLLCSWAGITQAIRFSRSADVRQYDHWIAVLEKLLADDPHFPSEDIEYQVAEGMYRAMFWRMPSHPGFQRWKQRALTLARSHPDIARRANTLYIAVVYELLAGNFAQARIEMEAAEAFELRELPPLVQNFGYLVSATYQREMGQVETCLQTVAKGLEVSAALGVHIWDFHLYSNGAFAALILGRMNVAEQLLGEMAKNRNVEVPGEGTWYHYLAAWLAARHGDLVAARTHAQSAVDLAAGWYFFEGMAHSALANVLLELRDFGGAATHAAAMLAIARDIGSNRLRYIGVVLVAEIAFNEGDKAAALAALKEAMVLGRECGYMYSAWWHPRGGVALCALALQAGIATDYVRQIISHHQFLPASQEVEHWPWPLRIYTLGTFNLVKDGVPLRPAIKGRLRLLLLYVVAQGGRDVGVDSLKQALWADSEGDAAHSAFEVALHRLRKLLGHDALHLHEGTLSLDERRCWVDVWAAQPLLAAKSAGPEDIDKALRLYQGHFLEREAEHFWMLAPRERLRSQFRDFVARIGEAFERDRQLACSLYQSALQRDPVCEEFYRRLMLCHRALGENANALEVYEQCRRMLEASLGARPSAQLEAVRRSL